MIEQFKKREDWVAGEDYPKWMKDRSLATLEGGYLLPGETPRLAMDRMAQRVAELTPETVYNGDLKKRVFEVMWNQEVSPSSPVWSNFGTPRSLPISCLTGDSWINVRNRGGVKMEDIKIGDEVLTHKGRWQKVTHKESRMSEGDLYELTVNTRRTPIKITGNHQVLTNLGWVRVDELDDKKHFIATNYLLSERDDMTQYIDLGSGLVEVTADISWSFGFLNSHIERASIMSDSNNLCKLYITNEHLENGKRFTNILSDLGCLVSETQTSGYTRLEVMDLEFCTFFKSRFLDSNLYLSELPEFILNNTEDVIRSFIEGFLEKSEDEIKLTGTAFALSFYQACLSIGKEMTLGFLNDTWILSEILVENDIDITHDGTNAYNEFSLTKLGVDEKVFDITVAKDSSFSVSGVVVHNCFNTHIQDSISGIYQSLAENAKMTQLGGGTSSYWGDVRPRGSKINNQEGTTGGPYEFIGNYDEMINKVSQGSCYQEGTQVLTDKGFIDFRDVDKKTHLLAQLDDVNNITWTEDYELVESDFKGDLIKIKGKKKNSLIDIGVTPNHRMVLERVIKISGSKVWSGSTTIVPAEDLKLHRDNRLFISGKTITVGDILSTEEKLKIAFQADGTKNSGDNLRFRFKKKRKIKRIKLFCEELDLEYSETIYPTDGVTEILIKNAKRFKLADFSWIDLKIISEEWAIEFLDEISLWDGHKNKHRSSSDYCSINKDNVSKVQEVAILAGKRTRIYTRVAKGNRKDLFNITISDIGYVGGDATEIYKESYDGKVYCAVVPKGRLLVKFNDRVLVCGNTRRGSHAVYIPFSHPAAPEFLTMRKVGSDLQNLFYGITISDKDIQKIYDGDIKALELWAKILESRSETGVPYLFYEDNVNNGATTPPWYGLENSKIKSSNLCILGTDRVVSSNGYLTAKELHDLDVELELFDGESVVKASKMKLRQKDAEVYKITLEGGLSHTVTADHGLPKLVNSSILRTECKNLIVGDKLAVQTTKGLFGEFSLEGDVLHILEYHAGISEDIDREHFNVPNFLWKSDEKTIRLYHDGIFNYAKKISRENSKITFTSVNKIFIEDLQILFRNLGFNYPAIYTETVSELIMESEDSGKFFSIVSIEPAGKADVYCPTVYTDEHIFVSQGLKTFNCTEVLTPSNDYESFVCCLLSMNAITYDNWKKTDSVNIANIFMDAILQDFIIKTTGMQELQKARRFAERHRSVGLGILGYHSYLQKRHQPYVGMFSSAVISEMFSVMKKKSRESSRHLAKLLGNAPVVQEYNEKYSTSHLARHSTLLSVAPTVSNATIGGGLSPSMGPWSSNYFSMKSAKGSFTVINEDLQKLIKDRYPQYDNAAVWASIRDNMGSVQHLSWMSDWDKDVFKTSFEINQFELVRLYSIAQKYVDQGISLNVYIDPKTDPSKISLLYLMGHELGIKTFYYQRSKNVLRDGTSTIDSMEETACTSCEG